MIGAVGSPAAQQTLFNVPSSDVLDRQKVYVELDASFKPVNPKFSSFVPRVVVGLGRRTEAGFNLTGNIQPGPDKSTLVAAFKWMPFEAFDKDWSLVAGNNLYFAARNQSPKFGTYIYLQLSKTLNRTRVTAGSYYFSNNVVAPNAQRAGGQFGLEQALNPKLTLAADWLTGKQANGYVTAGAIVKPHPKATGYFGYSVGNSGVTRGNHFFLFEAGFNIN